MKPTSHAQDQQNIETCGGGLSMQLIRGLTVNLGTNDAPQSDSLPELGLNQKGAQQSQEKQSETNQSKSVVSKDRQRSDQNRFIRRRLKQTKSKSTNFAQIVEPVNEKRNDSCEDSLEKEDVEPENFEVRDFKEM